MSRLIIPIINSKISLLPGPAHYLDDRTRIDKLTDSDFGLVSKTPPEYAERLRTEHRCIFIELPNTDEVDTYTTQAATRLRYVLNNFTTGNPLLLDFAIHVDSIEAKGKQSRPRPIAFGEDRGTLLKTDTSFRMKMGTKREDLSQFYVLVTAACEKHKRLYLTLGKFNSALTRAKPTDRIIDATISLESMIQDDKNELSFKFALFNAFAGSKDQARRMEAFELLRNLYNTRSTIVHGAGDDEKEIKLVSAISERWPEVDEIIKRAINEFVFYVQDNSPKMWTKHLLGQIVAPSVAPI